MEKQTHSLEEAITQIRLAGSKKNLGIFEEVSDSLITIWEKENPKQYAKLLLEICNNLSSYDFQPREKRMELLEQYSSKALFDPDLSLEIKDRIEFQHYLYYAKKQRSWNKKLEFKAEREVLTRQYLKTLNFLFNEIDFNFNVKDIPETNILPPFETGMPAGIDPKHINDYNLKKEYEIEIEKNRENNKQMHLHQIHNDYPSKLENYLLDVYSNNTDDIEALRKLFEDLETEGAYQNTVLNQLKSKN